MIAARNCSIWGGGRSSDVLFTHCSILSGVAMVRDKKICKKYFAWLGIVTKFCFWPGKFRKDMIN